VYKIKVVPLSTLQGESKKGGNGNGIECRLLKMVSHHTKEKTPLPVLQWLGQTKETNTHPRPFPVVVMVKETKKPMLTRDLWLLYSWKKRGNGKYKQGIVSSRLPKPSSFK